MRSASSLPEGVRRCKGKDLWRGDLFLGLNKHTGENRSHFVFVPFANFAPLR
jgi:hypothetical protein